MEQLNPPPPETDDKRINILQINLNHCKNAQELLTQSVLQHQIDLVVISEPWQPPSYWFNDDHKNASIWIPQPAEKFTTIKSLYKTKGIVSIQVDNYIYISCYFSPNISIESYVEKISELENFLNTVNYNNCVIAGDFNAKSPSWGSNVLDNRGSIIMETCNNFDLLPINSQGKFTFERNGHYSKIDILIAGTTVARDLISSHVLNEYTASDHRYILHALVPVNKNNNINKPKIKYKINIEKFTRAYRSITRVADPLKVTTTEDIDAYIDMISELYETTSFSTHNAVRCKKEAWWWNSTIASIRKKSISSRRSLQRARARFKKHPDRSADEVDSCLIRHNLNKKNLKT